MSSVRGVGDFSVQGRLLTEAEIQEVTTAMDYRAHGDRLLQSALMSPDATKRAMAEEILMQRHLTTVGGGANQP